MSSEDLQSQMMIAAEFQRLLDRKEAGLIYYSPYSFLHEIEPLRLCRETFIGPLRQDIDTGKAEVTFEETDGCKTWFVWRVLGWDSEYFQRKVIRLEIILPDHDNTVITGRAITRFTDSIIGDGGYISVNIPSEDLFLLSSMAHSGFRLVETRLNYYFNSFERISDSPAPARRAVHEDIEALREVAMKMKNRFDRVHADPAFSDEVADAYLGTFIEEAVKGFADLVMVPDLNGVKPFGFLAADFPVEVMGLRIAKLVLAAADNSEHKGWLSKLLMSVILELKQRNTDILTTITQASNRPAIRSWEKGGFRLGYVTHLYSYHR